MLTPVSFRKGRATAPRLSAPYVPGRHSERYWSEAEIAVLLEHYVGRGAAYCLTLLPRRTLTGVYARAKLLKLATTHRTPRAERIGGALDETIRQRWPGLAGRGAVAALADEIGVERGWLSQRALHLGLTLPHKKEPRWTEAEDALLRIAPVNDPKRAVAFFAAHGFKRSPASIMARCKRHGISRRRRDVLTASAAARILGVDNKTMATWCADGLVAATRRGSSRLPQQGGDMWSITPAALRQFVVDQVDRLDIRKVDKHAFVALLTGALDAADDPAA